MTLIIVVVISTLVNYNLFKILTIKGQLYNCIAECYSKQKRSNNILAFFTVKMVVIIEVVISTLANYNWFKTITMKGKIYNGIAKCYNKQKKSKRQALLIIAVIISTLANFNPLKTLTMKGILHICIAECYDKQKRSNGLV